MIIRMWRGRAVNDRAEAYRTHVSTRVFPMLRRMEGFLRGRLFQREIDGRIEVLVVTEWASMAAIRAFAGDDVSRAVVEPEARACLEAFDERVDHFDLAVDTAASAPDWGEASWRCGG
jgi:heme-degrading monooxygenase HmoA